MPEQQNIEWKESWRDEYLKWICGFANAQGGKLYIGCDDGGKVVGVSDSKKLLEDIPNKIRDAMGIVVDVNRLTEGDREYIEIDVPPYPIGISCKGVYHYRSGSTKQVLTGPALEAFLMRKHGATWDHSPLPVFKAEEVDDQIVEHFKKLAAAKGRINPALLNESKEVLMEKLRLTNGDYLTNAAMLLFCKDPDKYQLGSYIKIGYFESDSDLLYQDEVHGSILEQVDKAIELIFFKYMRAKITYEGIYRRERYFVPEDRIVRVNNKVNDRVNVHVNDRENTLLSYLAQDPGYTVTQLAVMMSVSRKTIAGYLKNLKEKGAIERIGTTRTGYWKIK